MDENKKEERDQKRERERKCFFANNGFEQITESLDQRFDDGLPSRWQQLRLTYQFKHQKYEDR